MAIAPCIPVCGNNDGGKGAKLFKQNCAVCHSAHTDQNFTGPGLKGIFDRVPSEEWFIRYTLNCEKVLHSGDSYAKKLHKQSNGAQMTIFEGALTESDVREIISFLK